MSSKNEQICSGCGLEKKEWQGNRGQGYRQEGDAYCCIGCAEGAGCTCLENGGGIPLFGYEQELPFENKQRFEEGYQSGITKGHVKRRKAS